MRFQRSMTVLLSLCMTIGMFGVNLFARSSTASANGQTLTAEMWRVAEIGMSSAVAYSNPFLDVEVTATFTGPGGEVIVRPGFWDGGNEWKVRFAPTALGVWSYRISSSDPLNAGLKLSGTLTAVPYTGDREVYQRGFLRVSDEGAHLSYADGTPFFWLGDTHWFFDKNESWDTSNKSGTSSQFKSIVDRRVAQKFTVYQSVIFGPHDSYWAAGQQGTEINPDYFKNELDRKMAYIADSGLVNAFGIGFHSNIDGFVQGSERLAAYVAARYGAYPVVWITSGEGAGYDLGPRESRIDGWRSVGKAINKYDGYNHPQTAHSTALTEKESLGLPQFYEGEGWFDFEMFQGGHQKMVPSGDYDYYHRQYGLPFLESEANYEQIYNGWATDTIVRQSAYRSVQAGGMGYGYGAHGIWNASWDDADTANDYGYGHRNWYDAIDFVGADQMTHLIDFYRSLDWQRMTYRPTGWATWTGEHAEELTDPLLRADDAANAVTVYFNADTSSQGTLTQLDAQAAYESRWFNPRTGAYTTISGSFTPAGGAWSVPEKPDAQDWLLLVKKLTPSPSTLVPASLETLVSQGKPASASTINQGTLVPADAAFDGDYGTFWTAADGQFPQWLQVDLGKIYELSGIEQTFYNANDWNYAIEGSTDGQSWQRLIDRTGAPVYGTKFAERVSGKARYVRLLATGSSNDWASSTEFKVYAKINSAAAVRSTAYLVDDRERTVSKVPAGTSVQQFMDDVVPSVNASMRLLLADGVTEVTQGSVGNGMTLSVESEDGSTVRSYTVQTVSNKGVNLARTAAVTVSSVENEFYSAANLIDGNSDTLTWSGWAAKLFPAWVELDFGSEKTFNRIDLYTKKNYEQKEYTMQIWNGTAWTDLFPTVTDNTADHRAHVFEPIAASKLRVWMTRGNVQQDTEPSEGQPGEKVARINELEVYLSPGDKLIEQLTVQGAGGVNEIVSAGGTLQMTATAQPSDASELGVVWTVTGTDDAPTTLASISKGGLLTAKKNGTVKVTAAALDGSAVKASVSVAISGQSTEPQSELLSLNKPVQASSVNGPAEAATDGNESTAWIASDGTFPQWIVVDLQQVYEVDRIDQTFFNEDQWKYRLEGSTDGTAWTEWIDRTTNQQATSSFSHAVDGTARYVKMTVTGAKSEWPNWASSVEFSIYGKPPAVDPGNGNGNGEGNGGETGNNGNNGNGGETGNSGGSGNSGSGAGGAQTGQAGGGAPSWTDGSGGKPELALLQPADGTNAFRIDAALLGQGFARTKPSANGVETVAIKLPAAAGATSYTLELPASALRDGQAGQRLEIVTPLGKLLVPLNQPEGSVWSNAARIGIALATEGSSVAIRWTADGKPISFPVSIRLALPVPAFGREGDRAVVRRIDKEGRAATLALSRFDSAAGEVWFNGSDSFRYETAVVRKSFSDLGNRSWLLEPIHMLAARDIIKGVTSTEFKPDLPVSRAEFVVMLMRMLDEGEPVEAAAETDFPDVKPGSYYYNAVRAAKALGIAQGDGYNTFNPAGSLSRQDMSVLLARLLSRTGAAEAPSDGNDNGLAHYADDAEVSPYARSSLELLTAEGIMEGDGKLLHPRKELTRGEAAAALFRMLKRMENDLLQ